MFIMDMPLPLPQSKAILKPFKAKLVVAAILLCLASGIGFGVKDAIFVRDMIIAGGFSITLSALNVLVIGKIWSASHALDASGETDLAARKLVTRIMACAITKLMLLMLGLTCLVVLLKLQAVAVLIGVSADFAAIFAIPFFAHTSVPADTSVSQQNRDA